MRLRVVASLLIVLLLALPSLMGSPPPIFGGEEVAIASRANTEPAAFEEGSSPRPGFHRDAWLDFLRTLVGTFIGACLAFGFNLWLHKLAARRTDKSAGNLAMSTLTRQYNGFLQVRATLSNQLESCRREAPDTPAWFAARPIRHVLSRELTYDFGKLAFLFEGGELTVFEQLSHVQDVYLTLLLLVDGFSDAAITKQEKMDSAGFAPGVAIPTQRIVEILGFRLLSELEGNLAEIQFRFKGDERKYLDASAALHAALVRRFGRKGLFRVIGARQPDPPGTA